MISAVFGHSLVEVGVVLAAVGYVISVVKDWRPIRTLRTENSELRGLLENAEKKVAAREAEVAALRKATDLTVLQQEHKQLSEEHRQITDALEKLVGRVEEMNGSLKANTAALELVERGGALKQALEDETHP